MTSAFLKITNRSFVRVDDSIFHNFLHFSSLLGLTGSLILLREPFADADCWACWIRIVDLKTTLIPNRSKKYSHRPNGENWKIPISSSLARIWWLSLLVFPPPPHYEWDWARKCWKERAVKRLEMRAGNERLMASEAKSWSWIVRRRSLLFGHTDVAWVTRLNLFGAVIIWKWLFEGFVARSSPFMRVGGWRVDPGRRRKGREVGRNRGRSVEGGVKVAFDEDPYFFCSGKLTVFSGSAT